MRIVSWNCNGALRKKYHLLDQIRADIYVIQECENPATSNDHDYQSWSDNYLWTGTSKNKGIGVFAREGIKLNLIDWSNSYQGHEVRNFLSCRVNDSFDLLAVWLHQNNSPNFGYIGQFWKYLQINKEKMTNTIIAGDFNSNVRWDQWDRWWNHSDVVRELNEIGIVSLYHRYFNEIQGRESKPTFYLHRSLVKPYHIDYCFAPKRMADKLTSLLVETFDDWIQVSDHVPMVITFDLNQREFQ